MDELKHYTIKEIMGLFSVSQRTVYNWFDRGLIKTSIGGIVRIKKEDIEKFISEGKA